VVRRLADAFDAAMTGDDPGLQQALKGFLRDAAMKRDLEIGVAATCSAAGLRPDAQAASLPLIRCASAAFADGMLPAQCLLAAPRRTSSRRWRLSSSGPTRSGPTI
jgi:hypothetical protein